MLAQGVPKKLSDNLRKFPLSAQFGVTDRRGALEDGREFLRDVVEVGQSVHELVGEQDRLFVVVELRIPAHVVANVPVGPCEADPERARVAATSTKL